MEVFLHNLPVDLSGDGLKDQLEPFMDDLRIVDFVCDKPKRKRIGNITFLNRRDAEVFLVTHGEYSTFQRGRVRPVSKLKILGTDVFCKPSNRPAQDFALKNLSHVAEERDSQSVIIEEESAAVWMVLRHASCGYCTFVDKQVYYIPEVEWQQSGSVQFTKRNMIVKFMDGSLIRIPLNTVIELDWANDGSLTLTLSTVPFFFASPPEIENLAKAMMGISINQNPSGRSSEQIRRRQVALVTDHAEVSGQCLVYQFHVFNFDLADKMHKLKKLELTISYYNLSVPRTILSAIDRFPSQLRTLKKELSDYTRDGSLPFGIRFQLQALAYNAYLPPAKVSGLARELRKLVRDNKASGKRPPSVEAIKKLFDTIGWPLPYGEPQEFKVQYLIDEIKQNDKNIQDGPGKRDGLLQASGNLTPICRVNVSPSRITLHGPEMEPTNRILRKFPNHRDYFIRVQFCNENGQDLQFSPRINNDDIFARFRNILSRGIEIAGRTYTFLGFSHSSLRSHSVWFSAPFMDDDEHFQTYFSIIKALGDFSRITTPARCAARIGQAFSDTPFAINLDENHIQVMRIPDVQSDDGQRVFSDGVGTVSWNVVETVWSGLPWKKGLPTCFQIRMGGAKGMLAVDSRLNGTVVKIRPSMIKFETDDMRDLEICEVGSTPIPLFLNRQMIKIMEDLGVFEDWFFKLQGIRIAELREATATMKNTADFIKGQSAGDSIRLHRLFTECHIRAIDYKTDPFLRLVVEAVVLRELRLLKHKARIPVRKGITLYGIMDETGFLAEGQVYITFDAKSDRYASPPGAGQVLVTRSPALFDGDIQLAYNAIPPKGHPLLDHKNCIVFSQKGKRDLPSQLSGGDLDGDMFNVIWDPEAMPTRIFPPADYPRVDPVDLGRPVTKSDMAEFFVDFMRTDRLGVIAIKHMIMADQMAEGTCHSDCKKLAQLHSTAVDFSKTGIPVSLEDIPWMNRFRPDFLAPGPQTELCDKSEIDLSAPVVPAKSDEDEGIGPPHKYYKSEKLLGKLYRAVDERRIWYEDVRIDRKSSLLSFWDEFIYAMTKVCNTFGPVRWTHRVGEARLLRSAYEDAILSAMYGFSEHPVNPISELEVFIGNILNKTGVQTHRQRERSIRLKDEFSRIATWIIGQMRPHAKTDAPLTGYETEMDALERCLACVCIGGEIEPSKGRRRRGGSGELESFRVVAACALLAEIDTMDRNRRI
ncbi:hypothetical protein MW887_001088 [Aspergillus wentii]|nr:hypothetical protein MW887_001088 [Aspergillus wentii]